MKLFGVLQYFTFVFANRKKYQNYATSKKFSKSLKFYVVLLFFEKKIYRAVNRGVKVVGIGLRTSASYRKID